MAGKMYGKDGSGKVQAPRESMRQHVVSAVVDVATEGRAGVRYLKKKYINDSDVKRQQEKVKKARADREKKYTE